MNHPPVERYEDPPVVGELRDMDGHVYRYEGDGVWRLAQPAPVDDENDDDFDTPIYRSGIGNDPQ